MVAKLAIKFNQTVIKMSHTVLHTSNHRIVVPTAKALLCHDSLSTTSSVRIIIILPSLP